MRLCFSTALTIAMPSPMVRLIGFSHQMSFPALAASMAMSECQWGGVATWTTSMSSRAISSRKSWYPVIPLSSALASFMRLARWFLSTSQSASNLPGMVRCALLMPPQPIMPLVISSDGGVCPLRPSTRLGTIWMVARAASDLMDWRRVIMRMEEICSDTRNPSSIYQRPGKIQRSEARASMR